MRKLLPLLLLSVCCSASARWVVIACAASCEQARFEYDPERTNRSGQTITVWIRSGGELIKEVQGRKYKTNPNLYSEQEKNKYDNEFSYSLTKWEINCKSWEMRTLDGTDYDLNQTPFGAKVGRSDFSEIHPDSLMDVAASKLCKKK